ncbi:NUDIX domain-containing protein [soil metagenome]
MMVSPQFGRPHASKPHRDRPAAFGLALRDGKLAVVRITLPDRPPFLDLPGGAIDPGEGPEQALIREFGEETGLVITVGQEVTRASQYFLTRHDEPVNNRCIVFEVQIVSEAPGLKVEQDHELVWVSPDHALATLRQEAHAWGVAAWLRSRT